MIVFAVVGVFIALKDYQNGKKETDPEVIAMRGLVNRVVPEYSKHIVLQRINDTIDCFEIETMGKDLVIRGNNANSMAVGLNHYLKYYC
ncbi:MAG: alpha-N-acetylglucosaminidase N-terminal domain-containing protein, partial [Bacteroidales bacterium]|nr:alpha-N-acetylglucosaminidase N-terminal domain-containing protein [Bacteroidales bacterium]